MKILVVISSSNEISGEVLYVVNVCRLLMNAGVEIKMIVQSDRFETIDFFNSFPAVEVFPYYTSPKLSWLISESLINFGVIRAIRRVIREFRPDVIHLHNIKFTKSILIGCSGLPIVQTIHELTMIHPWFELPNTPDNFTMTFYKKIIWAIKNNKVRPMRVLVNYILFNNLATKKKFISCFIIPSLHGIEVAQHHGLQPVCYLPHFISLPSAVTRIKTKKLLFVGRLEPVKGLTYLLQAFAKALVLDSDLTLVIIGEGGYRTEAEVLIANLKISDKVFLAGKIDPADLPDYYQDCLAVAIPSVVAEIGPLVALEAMSHARPVIAFNIGGLRELVEHTATGILVDVFDVAGLATAILDLARNWDRAERLGLAGREKVKHHFSGQDHLKKIMAAYHATING